MYPVAFAGLQDSRVDAAIAGQNAVFNARREATAGEREVLEQRIEQLSSQSDGIRAVRASNARLLRPGTALMDIVPEQLQLVIEAEVSPLDIDRIQAGDRARIRFSAFKSATTLVAEGTIITISADRLLRESGGAPYYLAQVEVDPASLARMPHVRLLPGMPAEVLINTGSRTLLQYLLQPASNVIARSFLEE